MKRTIGVLAALLLVGSAGQATATPVTWTPINDFQAGGHIEFAYTMDIGLVPPAGLDADGKNVWHNIDVVNVWDVQMLQGSNGGTKIYFKDVFTGLDVDGNGTPGTPMMDGPFVGFSASFDFDLTLDATTGLWEGGGTMYMYMPDGTPLPGNGGSGKPVEDILKSSWNGEFDGMWYPNVVGDVSCQEGDTTCGHVGVGVYGLRQVNNNNFNKWWTDSITTYGNGSWVIPTADVNSPDAGAITFTVPIPTTAVPEPAAMLLVGAGLAGLVGLRRRK